MTRSHMSTVEPPRHTRAPLAGTAWPPLPYDAWRESRDTLHRWTQIVGKLQLALTPQTNHWWNVALEVTPRGVASTVLPCGDRWLDLELDFVNDALRIRVSDGMETRVPLAARPVAEFYLETMDSLRRLGIECQISPIPQEVDDRLPFDRDDQHRAYDKRSVMDFWHIVARTAELMRRFSAGFVGKESPVQFYWGHLDLALTRFSGRPAPYATENPIEREAYSHELFSVGWWPGDHRLEKAAFYAYAYPEPPGFATADVATPHAYYHPQLHGFYLDYDDARAVDDPDRLIADFFQATYERAADLGRWDRAALERR